MSKTALEVIDMIDLIREKYGYDSCEGCKHYSIGHLNGACDSCIRIEMCEDKFENKGME